MHQNQCKILNIWPQYWWYGPQQIWREPD